MRHAQVPSLFPARRERGPTSCQMRAPTYSGSGLYRGPIGRFLPELPGGANVPGAFLGG
jgi:hypothetical protein